MSGEVDAYYDDVILYLKHKRYGVGVVNDHMKRNIRKMSESHYLEGDMLYHKWKTTSRIIPLRFDERYYIMENYHIDNKGMRDIIFIFMFKYISYNKSNYIYSKKNSNIKNHVFLLSSF